MTGELAAWHTEQATQTATLADPAVAAAAQEDPADPQATDAAPAEATGHLATAAQAANRTCCKALAAHIDDLTAHTTSLGPLTEEHVRAKHLAELVAGTSTDNQLRMHLEAYVLAARLEDVAREAGGSRLDTLFI